MHTESSLVPPYRPGAEPAIDVTCPGGGRLVGSAGSVELFGSSGFDEARSGPNGSMPRDESGSATISSADTGSLPEVATTVMATTSPMSAIAAMAAIAAPRRLRGGPGGGT